MTSSFDDWLRRAAQERAAAGLMRSLVARRADDEVIDLAGNDYLGLARDPSVAAAAADAAARWGAGSTGSRLVSGTTTLHLALERDLESFLGAEAALVFSSGYLANLGVVGALAGADVLVVSDAANHASLIDACRLARSPVAVTPTGDVEAVRRVLADRHESRALVVTDGVSSIDGAIAPLHALHAVARDSDALLVVDEAHALGVIGTGGRGATDLAGIAAAGNVVRTVTLSKALGGQGGAVVGSRAVVDHLVNAARSFIFDTALAPPSVAAASAALRVLRSRPELPAQVCDRARVLAAAVGALPPDTAVVNLVIGDPAAAAAAALACRDGGVVVGCFRPPSVPAGTSRLRLTARADLTDAEIERAARVVVEAVKRVA
jgi:8-amino-7-oxononanoate synthase